MRILFQGDSITEAGRSRDNINSIGTGYPLLVKSSLGYQNPQKYDFFNRGISGNKVVDLYARMKTDIINLKPDVMSILIGVNDVWQEFSLSPNGVEEERFYKFYSMLIEYVKNALPNVKIMILEPFVLKSSLTKDRWEDFDREVRLRAKLAKKIADEFSLKFVPLQEGFDKLTEKVSADYWLEDGIHPTCYGHEFIKEQWLKAFMDL